MLFRSRNTAMDTPSITKFRRILSKLVTSRPHSISCQGREAQIALSASIPERASLFAALYPTYGLGDALADVTSSALLTQARALVVLHLQPEVKGWKDEVVEALVATMEVKRMSTAFEHSDSHTLTAKSTSFTHA